MAPSRRDAFVRHGVHRDDRAVEALALAIRLRAIRRRTSRVNAECDEELLEKSRLKLRATIRVDLFRDAVTRSPLIVHGVRDGDGALIFDWDGLGPACEAINH